MGGVHLVMNIDYGITADSQFVRVLNCYFNYLLIIKTYLLKFNLNQMWVVRHS